MPSQFATLYQSHAIPVLSDQLAEDVVRYPLGDLSNGYIISAIWAEQDAADAPERGHENKRKVDVTILDSTIVPDARDVYAPASDWADPAKVLTTPPARSWTVRAIARGTEPATVVSVEYREMEIRNGKGGRLL
jgi:hypothetical protein